MFESKVCVAVLGFGISSSAGLAQEFMLLDGQGGLYRGEIGSAELVDLGAVEAPYTARATAFATDRDMMYIGNGIEGEVWVTDPDAADLGFLVNPSSVIEGSMFRSASGLATDGSGWLYVYVFTTSPVGEYLVVFDERTGEHVNTVPITYSNGERLVLHASMMFAPDGMMYSLTSSNDLYHINPVTGAADLIQHVDGISVARMAITDGQLHVAASDAEGQGVVIYKLNSEDSSLEYVQEHVVNSSILGFAFITGTPADMMTPYGDLDISDAIGFLNAFAAQEPDADLAPPQGVHDYADVLGFMTAFVGVN